MQYTPPSLSERSSGDGGSESEGHGTMTDESGSANDEVYATISRRRGRSKVKDFEATENTNELFQFNTINLDVMHDPDLNACSHDQNIQAEESQQLSNDNFESEESDKDLDTERNLRPSEVWRLVHTNKLTE